MAESSQVPMFPLQLLPLPGELVPLHIFEPRYRQLLAEAESNDIGFGIYCTHELNEEKIGSWMKLESVLKRYKTGESDIVVKCVDTFHVHKLFRTHQEKLYPGGEVKFCSIDLHEMPDPHTYQLFLDYQSQRNINNHYSSFSIFQIAAELNPDLFDRYKLLTYPIVKRNQLINNLLKFHLHLINREQISKDLYHLN